MSGIGIILNRNAGSSRSFRGGIGEKLGFVMGDRSTLRETRSVVEIDDVARCFLEKEIDILGIAGGDGSNLHVLSSFIRTYGHRPLPKVLFLRGGTHNACAKSIGLKGTPDRILDQVVRKYHAGERIETTCRSIMRLDDGLTLRHGFTLATGFLYRFIELMHQRRRDSPWKVALLLASMYGDLFIRSRQIADMFRLQPAGIRISGEDLDWQTSNGLAASTMEQIGVGMKPFDRANETPDTFQVMAFRVTPARFALASWRLLCGRLREHPQVLSTITDQLVLEADAPIRYALDGDLFQGGTRLQVSSGPRLKLVLI